MKTTSWILPLLILLCALPVPASAGPYTYIDINPPGWVESRAVCVNAKGEVAGYGNNGSGERGFLMTSGGLNEILPPDASGARASWVNSRGDVAGTAIIGGRPHAFLYRDGRYLDPTPGWAFSEATFVGEDGVVAGTGERGAYLSRDGVTEVFPGFTTVVGANTAGYLIGEWQNIARLLIPDRGYLDVNPSGATSASPRGINDTGRVALSSLQSNSEKGFVYSGGFFIYMTPPGWTSSSAMAINNQDQVVGYGDSPQGRRGFLRTQSEYEEIAFPGWESTEAVSVSDLGHVAGSGIAPSGGTHAFLASPASAPLSGGSPGTSEGASPAGGGCSLSPGRSEGISPTSTATAGILFLPPVLLWGRRMVRRRVTVTPR